MKLSSDSIWFVLNLLASHQELLKNEVSPLVMLHAHFTTVKRNLLIVSCNFQQFYFEKKKLASGILNGYNLHQISLSYKHLVLANMHNIARD